MLYHQLVQFQISPVVALVSSRFCSFPPTIKCFFYWSLPQYIGWVNSQSIKPTFLEQWVPPLFSVVADSGCIGLTKIYCGDLFFSTVDKEQEVVPHNKFDNLLYYCTHFLLSTQMLFMNTSSLIELNDWFNLYFKQTAFHSVLIVGYRCGVVVFFTTYITFSAKADVWTAWELWWKYPTYFLHLFAQQIHNQSF